MKKKILAVALAAVMAAGLMACGGSSASSSAPADGSTGQAAAPASASSGEGIRLLNGKPEIDTQLKALAAKYQEDFVIEANQAPNWDGLLADMSGEQWTEDTDYELVDEKMGTIGFPYTVEATALAYNAEILEKAGVDPATLTSPAAWQAAVETIDGKKDELGITAVFGWCAEPANLGWSSGTHVFGQYLDAGLAQDDTTYIDLLNDGGKIDEARMTSFAAFVGMMNQYSDPDLLVSGTYDEQVAGFAAGKYAFVTQGNWINGGVTGSADYTGWAMGFAPYAFEDGIDTIIAGPPSFWTVYSDGDVDAAKAFLQWVSDDSAQDILVNQANLISPFNDCKYTAADPFAESIMGYMAAGKTSGWHTMLKKDGLQNKTCQVFAEYAKGTLDQDGFVKTMAQVISSYYNQ